MVRLVEGLATGWRVPRVVVNPVREWPWPLPRSVRVLGARVLPDEVDREGVELVRGRMSLRYLFEVDVPRVLRDDVPVRGVVRRVVGRSEVSYLFEVLVLLDVLAEVVPRDP